MLPLLAETGGKNEVKESLLSIGSYLIGILKNGAVVRANREKPYEIGYYLHTDENAPVPQAYQTIFDEKIASVDNPVKLLNPLMVESAEYALKTISSQLPGRFLFKRVDDPSQAKLLVAGIEQLKNDRTAGTTIFSKGAILIAEAAHRDKPNCVLQSTTIHEIEHGLGLEHPQDRKLTFGKSKEFSKHIEGASYFDTLMTYDEENDSDTPGRDKAYFKLDTTSQCYPVSLMPADLKALIELYPLASDKKNVAMVGPAITSSQVAAVHVASIGADGRTSFIPFPKEGIIYHPQKDTRNNTLVVSGNLNPLEPLAHFHSVIRQVANGTEIVQPTDRITRGSVLVPIRPETIVLATDVPHQVEIMGNTQVVVQTPMQESMKKYKFTHEIFADGKKNTVELSVDQVRDGTTQLIARPGAELKITFKDAASLAAMSHPFFLHEFIHFEISTASAVRLQWHVDKQQQYHLSANVADKSEKPINIIFALDTHDKAAHAKFQLALSQPWEELGDKPVVPERVHAKIPSYEPMQSQLPMAVPGKVTRER